MSDVLSDAAHAYRAAKLALIEAARAKQASGDAFFHAQMRLNDARERLEAESGRDAPL